jgi:hypothetical protein
MILSTEYNIIKNNFYSIIFNITYKPLEIKLILKILM